MTAFSLSAGPAADLDAALDAALERIGLPAGGGLARVGGHVWLDERVLDPSPSSAADHPPPWVAELAPDAQRRVADPGLAPDPDHSVEPAATFQHDHARVEALTLLILAELALESLGPGAAVGTTTASRDDVEDVLWALGRAATAGQVAALFDQGLGGLADRIAASRSGPVRGVHQAIETVVVSYGHHGPNPWELAAGSWAGNSLELLAIVDLLRDLPDSSAPAGRRRIASVPADPAGWGHVWLDVRDRAAEMVAAYAQTQRIALARIADGLPGPGTDIHRADLPHLTRHELDALMTCGVVPDGLSLRGYDHRALSTFRAPVTVVGEIPAAVRWPREGGLPRLAVGELLSGAPAAPGAGNGPVTVLRSPSEVAALSPGDVLAVPTGTSAWNPLLPAVSALVVDAGRWWSPAAVTCRELGVPCVVATEEATGVLTTGGHVEVDGSKGVVTVTGGPGRRHHPSGRLRVG
ncbi:PEP-utilizing enzyme [Pseudonocardia terrae]|uniref:PEP-utilizing enzyme n=1 Tax=Pseudonocardia terrae TaxID=2905831 RepID=UPI001E284025|nr:PEP-utilizing enzyme [Pseudonocardia terrae]